jgi:hypothetical protein
MESFEYSKQEIKRQHFEKLQISYYMVSHCGCIGCVNKFLRELNEFADFFGTTQLDVVEQLNEKKY